MKNNMMKKVLVTTAVVAALASATLAGCGNSTSSSTSSKTTSTASTTASTTSSTASKTSSTASTVSSQATATGKFEATAVSTNSVKLEAENASKGSVQKVSFTVGENEDVQVDATIKDNGKFSVYFGGSSEGMNQFGGGDGKFTFTIKPGTYELSITSETENLTGTAMITTVPAKALRVTEMQEKIFEVKANEANEGDEDGFELTVGENELVLFQGSFTNEEGRLEVTLQSQTDESYTRTISFGNIKQHIEVEPGTYNVTVKVVSDVLNGSAVINSVAKEPFMVLEQAENVYTFDAYNAPAGTEVEITLTVGENEKIQFYSSIEENGELQVTFVPDTKEGDLITVGNGAREVEVEPGTYHLLLTVKSDNLLGGGSITVVSNEAVSEVQEAE